MSTITIPGFLIVRNAVVRFKKPNGDYILFEDVNDVMFNCEPFNVRVDALGRAKPAGYKVSAEFNTMRSDRLALTFYGELLVLDEIMPYMRIQDLRGNDLWIRNVRPVCQMKIDGNGKPGKIKLSVERIIKQNEVTLLTTNPDL